MTDMNTLRSHIFLGKRYRVQFLPKLRDNNDGETEPPGRKGKTIRLRKGMADDDLLETAIHEAIHACLWTVDEDTVGDMALDIARFLTRLGFRKGL